MPEGDTIFRIAARAAPVLTGQVLERVTTQGLVRNLAGRTVTAVAPHGKHLVIELDDGTHLRIHLGMNGRFRLFDRAAGDAALARSSPGRVSLAITIASHVLVWLTAPTVEISHRRSPRHGMALASLGADILADDFDPQRAAAAAADDARSIGEVLLDQRIAAGIGNVYKCEALFAAGIDPRSPASALGVERLAALYTIARTQMLANLGPGPRTTRARIAALSQPVTGERFFVYRRVDQACVRCGASIICYAQGHDPMRWTWSCPGCQVRLP
ncbi:MAG TPA: DNA-formamidopyrimidine glycosylase family protein [Kofleriaceae bacterium]|nr:DNA-formamidopyrimidine glycosylase family protein [Kofleriaceae bacterium]